MPIIHINDDNFEKEVLNQPKTVLLDFYADWCGPCQMIAPIVAEIADEHPEYVIGKINVDDEPALTQKFGISSIPALFVIKQGKTVANTIGYTEKQEILEMLE